MPTERVAVTVWLLSQGWQLSTKDIASLVGITSQGAYQMMDRVSRVVPVVLDAGKWRLMRS